MIQQKKNIFKTDDGFLSFFLSVGILFVRVEYLIPYPNHDDESLLISHESDYDTGSNQFS